MPLRAALAAVRLWTRAYTWGLPGVWAEQRRAEIESDLWEFQHDPEGARGLPLPLQIIVRLFAGLADDVLWRVECAALEDSLFLRRIVAVAAVATIVLSILWIWPLAAGSAVDPHGRTQISECASAMTPAESTAEFRLQVIKCTGAFFNPPTGGPPPSTEAR